MIVKKNLGKASGDYVMDKEISSLGNSSSDNTRALIENRLSQWLTWNNGDMNWDTGLDNSNISL